jgi:hypothetical protein
MSLKFNVSAVDSDSSSSGAHCTERSKAIGMLGIPRSDGAAKYDIASPVIKNFFAVSISFIVSDSSFIDGGA